MNFSTSLHLLLSNHDAHLGACSIILGLNSQGIYEQRLEDYIVSGLIDFDDIAYDEQADLLYDLATQVVNHFRTYIEEEDVRKVLQVYQRSIAELIHSQMQPHFWEESLGYEVKISRGFTELKECNYTSRFDYKIWQAVVDITTPKREIFTWRAIQGKNDPKIRDTQRTMSVE